MTTQQKRVDSLGNELDQDLTVAATCELCDGPADYDSELIVCPACKED